MDIEDLHKALGAFLICFGQGLPNEIKTKIRDRTYFLAQQIEHGGEPTVASIARGLADSLLEKPPMH